MLELLKEILNKYADNIAVYYQGITLTYKKLDEESTRLSNIINYKLKDSGKNRGVCFYLNRGINIIITMLAIIKSNCHYVPLDKKYPVERLKYIICMYVGGNFINPAD